MNDINPHSNKKKSKIAIGLTSLLLLAGCSHGPGYKRESKTILDRSYEEMPAWLSQQDLSWKDGDKVFYKNAYTVRGDQRVNACYDLARLGLFETILAEVRSELKAANDLASEGANENEDALLTKSLSETLAGTLRGIKIKSRAFERYEINQIERIDCHVLSEISERDYQKIKNEVVKAKTSVSDSVTEAVREKQKDFFKVTDKSE